MEILEKIAELLPYLASILACVVAFMKKGSVAKTAEEIEELAEAKKQKFIKKQNKKNKIKPSEPLSLDDKINKELVSLRTAFAQEEFLRDLKGGITNGNETSENV